MAEYTYSNIIIDPTKEGIESLIGKEVYFADQPAICLKNANNNHKIGIFKKIFKDSAYPFYVKTPEGDILFFSCIIPKKEEPKPKPKYVPFKNIREFLISYSSYERLLTEENCFLSNHGIWLKRKDKPHLLMVTEIYSFGVVISGDMNTTKKPNDEYVTITETTLWRELLRGYTFLDGTPCGKESKDV